jgi:cytochrome c oxidase subunit 2
MTGVRYRFAAMLVWAPTTAATPYQDVLLPAGPQAHHIHVLWLIMLGVCAVVLVAVVVAVAAALWRSPRSDEHTAPDMRHMRAPEPRLARGVAIALSISLAGLLALMIASVVTDRALAQLPLKDGVAIEVTAHQWWWQVRYEADEGPLVFDTANELHVPVGRPVIVKLQSRDVIHSFWVPNLHGKKDLIPGRITTLQFRADKPGTYRGQCAEFCGYQHAKMAFVVIADEPQAYEKWLASQREPAAARRNDTTTRGERVFMTSACVMCHSIKGTSAHGRTGPDLTHLASRRTLAAGTLVNTRGNLAGWIVDPQGVKPGANMPPTALDPDDLQALLEYLESLT